MPSKKHGRRTKTVPTAPTMAPTPRAGQRPEDSMTDQPRRGFIAPHERPNLLADLRRQLVAEAAEDLGKGEELANNRGPYVWSLTGRRTGGAWCAAAVYTWLLRACSKLEIVCPIPRTHGARRLCKRLRGAGFKWHVPPVGHPMPGDVVLWSRGVGWQGHVGVCAVGGLRFETIEGNVGRYPALVSRFDHDVGERRLLGWVRLA